MTPRMSSPAPAAPDADKPRLVCRYRGLQILDARENILVVIVGEPPVGARGGLRHEGFRRDSNSTWSAPATPMAILAAQAIGTIFFSEQEKS
jgi:hypothetical protein